MSSNFDAKTFLHCAEKTLDLPIKDEWRTMVEAHISNAARMMKTMESATVPTATLDLAGVYTPAFPDKTS